MPKRISPDQLGQVLPDRGLCWISACSGESDAFREGLNGLSLPNLTFASILVPGLNRPDYLLATGARVTTFFMVPELAASDRVTFLPLPYRDILGWCSANPPDCLLVMVSPPDADGICTLGAVTDFASDLWQGARTLIAHVNSEMPATRGAPGIPYDRFDAVIETPQPLRASDPGTDETSERIGALAASVIPDGATLQTGIGRMPEAVLRKLAGKRNLALHSGLIGDSALFLLESGALRFENPITTGVAIGTKQLYDALSRPEFSFRPPSYTHALSTLAGIDGLITLNSAIEVDLSGQVYAETTPKGPISGPGGASDFAAGARGRGGLRIIALPSTAARGTISRIVTPVEAIGPVSLGRFDTDLVITENGIADLRGQDSAGRAAALLSVADPAFRRSLQRRFEKKSS